MNKIYIFTIVVIFSLLSCEDLQTVIEIDLPEHKPKLVVNSINSVGDKWKAYVSVSKGPLTNEDFSFLSNASVLLLSRDQVVDTLSYNSSNNKYESTNIVQLGLDYTIQVSHPSYETVSASLIPFEAIPIKSVGSVDLVSNENANLEFEIDDPLSKNYYMINLKGFYKEIEDTSFYKDENIFFYSDDLSLDRGEYSNGILLFDDKLFDGDSKKFNLIFDNIYLDSLQLNLWSVDYAFYQYFTTKIIQSNIADNEMFNSEPVNVYNSFLDENGNINGYGIFGLSSKDSVIVKLE